MVDVGAGRQENAGVSAEGTATGRAEASRSARKSPTAYRTISEVSDELEIPQHVLRFWETKFSQVKPLKRGGGRRYYRPEDITLLRRIQVLLYKEGYTIKGVQKLLREGRAAERARAVMTDEAEAASVQDDDHAEDPATELVPDENSEESPPGSQGGYKGISAAGADEGTILATGDAEGPAASHTDDPARNRPGDEPGAQSPDAVEPWGADAEAPVEASGAAGDSDEGEGTEADENAGASSRWVQAGGELPEHVRTELEAVLTAMRDLKNRLLSDRPIEEVEDSSDAFVTGNEGLRGPGDFDGGGLEGN